MPGDDEEDIVMTSTDGNIRNTTCPLSGKPITELENPVRRCCTSHSKRFFLCFHPSEYLKFFSSSQTKQKHYGSSKYLLNNFVA